MPFGLRDHLATMSRVVNSTERDGRPAKAVVAARVYPTAIDDLWDAVTNPERLARWFLPVSGDLRLGGRYQLEGNAGGEIESCEPPRHVGMTWEYDGQLSWLTLRLSPQGGGTRLQLEHVAHVDEVFWPQYGPGAAGVGWDMGFLGLARHLADPSAHARPPEQDEAWMASDEAKDFIRSASDAWGRAAVDDGTPEADARQAAERTRASYTGEAPTDAAMPGDGGRP
jgi:uncharacterized protein YndB with AHSA1/START domain